LGEQQIQHGLSAPCRQWLWGPDLFKWRTVPISPFNLQSNIITSISSSLLVQIWYFFSKFF
jgi:hypothetical protein